MDNIHPLLFRILDTVSKYVLVLLQHCDTVVLNSDMGSLHLTEVYLHPVYSENGCAILGMGRKSVSKGTDKLTNLPTNQQNTV